VTALRGFVSQVVAEGGLTHRARRLGIDTGQEAVVYLRWDSEIVRSEGFDSQTRVVVRAGDRSLRATLGVVTGDLLATDEAGLSEAAWARLGATRDEALEFSHPRPLVSLGHVRAKTATGSTRRRSPRW